MLKLTKCANNLKTCLACPCPKTDSSAQLAWCCCVGFSTTQQVSVFELSQSAVGFYIIVLHTVCGVCGKYDFVKFIKKYFILNLNTSQSQYDRGTLFKISIITKACAQ